MNKMDEIILAAPRSDVFQNETLAFQGVNSEDECIVKIMAQIEEHFFDIRRGDAEEDPRFKQPIPYVVIRRDDEVFVYERLAGGGESRLHNKLSLGFGGHMNPMEGAASFSEVLKENTDRELAEELYIREEDKQNIVTLGLINDDENNVGKVHIGILSALQLASGAQVEVKEKDQIAGRWMKVSELKEQDVYQRLETWSQFVADILQ
ncbi:MULTISPECIES: hypothetical protein [Bacillus]|jgi:predicted NUDIX family phosphoesterase|uniref:Enzyme involved in deoxyribonucleotide synthesis n=1 Tax=Bacillus amyloliquefaciens (strain ATCC 23350 / DSM 7 / BCRC 11601 / CCUG 28519 / NBRC 15535 / NRRL B-14393 / F) TaxID=692420 RepID=A0A9P1JHC7_BACAS|nr:hypothetical protein [Bacillus amyloliquefaciens]AIW33736.1 hypothetical protein KS08_08815 [Bacillus subtilis]AEB23858.1 enzyme involved in deoxyribonucleotide synthesis [Bacillus amyloliquefaciens TA208]AEB63440.1 putative enzyme involved in deoxyribonucleotide synthesis [Bacillus amyloliquefaciens LL3]AEK88853.1 putative enzyme involved in deoxyribonucleotide synthesis [Bacillus amyloliquefaciens XH7]ARW39014.1 uncharacterized protein S101267_01926 [Bacillus amyloliquefaciens]